MEQELYNIYHGYPRKIGAYKTSYEVSRKVAVALALDLTGEEHKYRPVVARALHKYLATNKMPIHHNILRWPPGSMDGPDTSVFVSQVVFLKDDPDLGKKDLEEREEDRKAKAWLIEHGMEERELEWVSFWDRFGCTPYGIEEHRPVIEYTYSDPKKPREKEEWEKESDKEVEIMIAKLLQDEDFKQMLERRR